jgi:hypothetical protein
MAREAAFPWNCCCVDDFEEFDFFDWKIPETGEKLLQSEIVGGTVAKRSAIISIYIAVIRNVNVIPIIATA